MTKLKCEKIGQFLKNYRNMAGLRAEDVVQNLGLESVHDLHQFENGSRAIPLSMIYAFANIYEIPPDKIVELFYKLSEEPDDLGVEFPGTSGRFGQA